MKTDNSRYFEEKINDGYNQRNAEINIALLISIETNLYELTEDQYREFCKLRRKTNTEDWQISLNYVTENCKCINNQIESFNY
jgi:hypothetical protein